jgi:transposase
MRHLEEISVINADNVKDRVNGTPDGISASHKLPPLGQDASLLHWIWIFLANLVNIISSLEAENKTLREENAKLAEKANQPEKTSKNSSSRPSNNRYPAKKPLKLDENGEPIKGKPGAKKGHKPHHRQRTNWKKVKQSQNKSGDAPCEPSAKVIPTDETGVNPGSPDSPNSPIAQPGNDVLADEFEFDLEFPDSFFDASEPSATVVPADETGVNPGSPDCPNAPIAPPGKDIQTGDVDPKPDSSANPQVPRDDLEMPLRDIPTEEIEVHPDSTDCPHCGSDMVPCPGKDTYKEQYEMVDNPIVRNLYVMKAYKCPKCGQIHQAAEPATLATGMVGPFVMALIAFLKGVGHMSITGIHKFMAALGMKISRGCIDNNLDRCGDALSKAYDEVKEAIPSQPVLNIDETGHKENGKKLWCWVIRAKTFAFFAIKVDRASTVLKEFLGENFRGLIGCDYCGAYRKFLRIFPWIKAQFCLAHLKRDIQFLIDHLGNPELREYGSKLMAILVELFEKNKLYRRLKGSRTPDDEDDPKVEGEAREAMAQEVLEELRRIAQRLKEAALNPPDIKKAKNIAKRFLDWPDFYFTFLSDEGLEVGLEMTNNPAEQSVRFIVIDRHVTQGTRSIAGRMRSEKIWTAVATCAIQGRSTFDFLRDAIMAHFGKDRKYPSLLKED